MATTPMPRAAATSIFEAVLQCLKDRGHNPRRVNALRNKVNLTAWWTSHMGPAIDALEDTYLKEDS